MATMVSREAVPNEYQLNLLSSFTGLSLTKYASKTTIQLAHQRSIHPNSSSKGIYGTWRALTSNHAHVRKGQVYNKQVSLLKDYIASQDNC